MHSRNSFSKKSVGSVAIGALLIFGVYTILPMTSGAYAQGTVTITTSADAHNNRFFGPALLEVIFSSSQHAADNTQGTAQVTITAFGNTQTFSLTETGQTSGLFLMYVKVDDNTASPTTPVVAANNFSNTNTFLVVGPSAAAGNYVGGNAANLQVSAANIVEGGTIQFTFGGVSKTVTYDDTAATLTLDRSTYGSDSATRIYATYYDPDANLDPTTGNTLGELTANDLLSRDNVTPAGLLNFTETGTNTARFEAILNVVALTSGTSAGRSLTATDYKTFAGTNATHVQTTVSPTAQGTNSASYTVARVSGSLGSISSITYAGELPVTVNDLDRNRDSKAQETLTGALRVTPPGAATTTDFDLSEQSLNSNTFVPAFNQDRLILTWKQNTTASQGILRVLPDEEAVIRYQDAVPSTGTAANTSSITIKPSNTAPTLSSDKDTVGRSSVIALTMNDPDLNDDSSIIESYTVTFSGNTAATPVPAFPSTISPFTLAIERNGNSITINTDFSVTFTETGANTGIFTAEVDLSDLDAATPLSDGDTINIEVDDVLEQGESQTADVDLVVGIEKPSIRVDRSTVPVPRLAAADDQATHQIGSDQNQNDISNLGPVDIVITVTDPNRNNSTINQEILVSGGTTGAFTPVDANTHTHTFDSDGNNPRLVLTLEPAPNQNWIGNTEVVMVDALQETGFNTGIYQGTIQVRATNNDDPLWIGAKLKIEYKGLSTTDSSDDANAVTVTFTARQAVLSTDTSTVVNGGTVEFRVVDQDSNRDPESAESVFVRVTWTDANGNNRNRWLELEETGINTGVFTETVAVGDDQVGGTPFTVESDSEVEVFYYDLTPNKSAGSDWTTTPATDTSLRHERTLRVASASGALEIDITGATVGPSASIDITVFDTDANTNPNVMNDLDGQVTISTDRDAEATLNLDETAANSGRFVGTLKLQPDTDTNNSVGEVTGSGSTEVTITVLPGDVISVRYTDQSDENGRRTTISRQFTVTSVDPEIRTDKNVYAAGDQVTITVADLDADTDPDSNDIKDVRVTSTSDLVGRSVQLIETGPNTGVFEGTVTLSTQFTSGSITVRNGDTVTIKYTDTYPADYADRVDAGGTTSKDFIKTVQIGSEGTTRTTTPSAPTLRDAQNRPLTQVLAGQQVVLSTSVKNNEPASTPYAAIVEVRDSNDVTVFLNWQTGTLAADATTGIGLSWTPDEPGTYTVRVFVLNSLNQPQILSPVVTSTVTVS